MPQALQLEWQSQDRAQAAMSVCISLVLTFLHLLGQLPTVQGEGPWCVLQLHKDSCVAGGRLADGFY